MQQFLQLIIRVKKMNKSVTNGILKKPLTIIGTIAHILQRNQVDILIKALVQQLLVIRPIDQAALVIV